MSNDNISSSPGVFRGNCRLASIHDLCALRSEITGLIAGPLNDLSENGYIPWKYKNDGSVDVETLFPDLVSQIKEFTGLKISKDGVHVTDGIKSINFSGKYVSLDIDENGSLVVNIDQPNEAIARFNQSTSTATAVVKMETENLVDEVIIPDTSESQDYAPLYGTWEAGEKHAAIVQAHSDYDYVEFNTTGPVFASSKHTFFEVKVYDGFNNIKASFISKDVNSNTPGNNRLEPASANNSNYIFIYIKDFKEVTNGYSFKSSFKVNLAKIMTDGGRFKIEIIHHDDMNAFKYQTDDILYVIGNKPVISNVSYQVNSAVQPTYVWSSGIKYFKSGELLFKFNAGNLNKMAALEDKFDCDFSYLKDGEDEASSNNYSLDIENNSSWTIKLGIKKDILANKEVSGVLTAKNAYGLSIPYSANIKILINSLTSQETSNDLKETFTDESYRLTNTSNENWNSEASLNEYDDCEALMVVPGQGVSYPYGDWSGYLPNGSPDYSNNSFLINEKYFVREFSGNGSLKFGGIFVFGGISKNEFFNNRINVTFSADGGNSWYSLKDIRNSSVALNWNGVQVPAQGVLTDINEFNNKLFITWSYPGTKCSANKLLFKLGMKPTSPYCIKSIQLINLDGTEDW